MYSTHFTYAGTIQRLIDDASSKGTITVRHNRKKYELPRTLAKNLAQAVWGRASRTHYSAQDHNADFPTLYVYASYKTGRQALVDKKLLVKPPKGMSFDWWIERARKGYGWQLNKTGTAVARECFVALTNLDPDTCGAEVRRLRDEKYANEEAQNEEIRNGLRGMHNAEGRPITTFLNLRREDHVSLVRQIVALREQAAAD